MRITKHAKIRMQERGITMSHLQQAVSSGKRFPDRNNPTKKDCIVTKDIICMVSKDDVLITVFWNEKGRR